MRHLLQPQQEHRPDKDEPKRKEKNIQKMLVIALMACVVLVLLARVGTNTTDNPAHNWSGTVNYFRARAGDRNTGSRRDWRACARAIDESGDHEISPLGKTSMIMVYEDNTAMIVDVPSCTTTDVFSPTEDGDLDPIVVNLLQVNADKKKKKKKKKKNKPKPLPKPIPKPIIPLESITSWETRALRIQTEIDNTAVLSQSFWAGAHNAFANSHDAKGIIDPNQKLSIKNQLESGVREFSLDVYKPKTKTNIRVCHGFCSKQSGDLSFKDVLSKFKSWIDNNRGAVVLLKLEVGKSAENNRQKVAKAIRDKIGQYVYQTGSKNRAGVSLPAATLTKKKILAAGKNVIVLVFNHVKTNSNSELFNQYVFYKGTEVEDAGQPSKVKNPTGIFYRVKMGETKYGILGGEVTNLKTLEKVYNNWKNKVKNVGKKLFGKKKKKKKKKDKIKPLLAPLKVHRGNINEWLTSGINIVELYGFNADDKDWYHAGTAPCLARDLVWSWDESSREPKLGSSNSAAFVGGKSNRFHTTSTQTRVRCACRKSDGTWGITNKEFPVGSVSVVSRYCQTQFGSGATFASPMMKTDLDALVSARNSLSASLRGINVGINYFKRNGKWVANQ